MSTIYGREKVRYALNISNDLDNYGDAIQVDTTDWTVDDTLLDGTDNSDTYTDINHLDKVDKVYESKGTKSVYAKTDFDDGWGNIYEHETDLDVEAVVYVPPITEYSWTPEQPTILDTVTIAQAHDDTRDDTLPKAYGRIDEIKLDYYNDGVYEVESLTDVDTHDYQFTTKEDGIEVRMNVTYWDGWEHQTVDDIRTLDMANIPPVSEWDREDNGVCIPAYVWTATSTDLDDDDTLLTYNWVLEQDVGGVWNLVDTGTEFEYSYPFQFEGQYRLTLTTYDVEGYSHDKVEEFAIAFGECNSDGTGDMAGVLRLQLGGFQLVALPVDGKKVSDMVDVVASKLGMLDSEVIEVCNAAPGNEKAIGNMLNYVPGVTNKLGSNNFDLVMDDGEYREIAAFWVKTLPHATLDYVDIEWNSSGEIK
jgi:hypothetical protein